MIHNRLLKRINQKCFNIYLQLCWRSPLQEQKTTINFDDKWSRTNQSRGWTHWTCGSARTPCRVGAPVPAAPTSRSSRNSWRSSWRGSPWAGGRRGFLSPPRCPDQTATLWSSSGSQDWPSTQRTHGILHWSGIRVNPVHVHVGPSLFLPPRYSQLAPGSAERRLKRPRAPVWEEVVQKFTPVHSHWQPLTHFFFLVWSWNIHKFTCSQNDEMGPWILKGGPETSPLEANPARDALQRSAKVPWDLIL